MTRNELIAIVGSSNVDALEALNCEPTSRDTTMSVDCGFVEFASCLRIGVGPDDQTTIWAYYYQTEEDVKGCADLGSLDWDVDHYTIN